MSSYDFITNSIRFSYSSTSTFDTCPYAFKLTYIDALSRENNFFSDYGTFIHQCFEQFFGDGLEPFELSQYYSDNYDRVVKIAPPSSPLGMGERYRQQGQDFFDNFEFDKSKYDILLVEDKIDTTIDGINIVARPDLILKDKETGKTFLYDYKTSAPFRTDKRTGKETEDKQRMEGYRKQMFIYAYAVKKEKGIQIDEMVIWFPRLMREVHIAWNQAEEDEAILSISKTIEKIKLEEVFSYNNTNTYFCNVLCGVRSHCEYK